jgi:hypothetical protein
MLGRNFSHRHHRPIVSTIKSPISLDDSQLPSVSDLICEVVANPTHNSKRVNTGCSGNLGMLHKRRVPRLNVRGSGDELFDEHAKRGPKSAKELSFRSYTVNRLCTEGRGVR